MSLSRCSAPTGNRCTCRSRRSRQPRPHCGRRVDASAARRGASSPVAEGRRHLVGDGDRCAPRTWRAWRWQGRAVTTIDRCGSHSRLQWLLGRRTRSVPDSYSGAGCSDAFGFSLAGDRGVLKPAHKALPGAAPRMSAPLGRGYRRPSVSRDLARISSRWRIPCRCRWNRAAREPAGTSAPSPGPRRSRPARWQRARRSEPLACGSARVRLVVAVDADPALDWMPLIVTSRRRCPGSCGATRAREMAAMARTGR